MQSDVLCGTTGEKPPVRNRILSLLAQRNAVSVTELSFRIGVDEFRVRNELEDMIISGEVERLRPVGYDRADYDFFAANRRKRVYPAEAAIPARL